LPSCSLFRQTRMSRMSVRRIACWQYRAEALLVCYTSAPDLCKRSAILGGPRYVVRPGNHTRDRQEGGGRRDGGSAQERLDDGGGCRGYRGRSRVLRENGRHAGGKRTRLPGQGALGGGFQQACEVGAGRGDCGRIGSAGVTEY